MRNVLARTDAVSAAPIMVDPATVAPRLPVSHEPGVETRPGIYARGNRIREVVQTFSQTSGVSRKRCRRFRL